MKNYYKKNTTTHSDKNNTNQKIEWIDSNDWNLRKNTKRHTKDVSYHPAIEVGHQGNKIVNIGITHQPKRGHHSNEMLSQNPERGRTDRAYARDDVSIDDKYFLKEIINDLRDMPQKDKDKIYHIIQKYKNKKR